MASDRTRPSAAPSPAEGGELAQTRADNARRRVVLLSAKLFVGMLVIAAPVLIASAFVPGVIGVAFYGVLAGAFGWIAGGPRVASAVIAGLAVLGVVSISLAEHTWLLAIILIGLGLGYGYAAARGAGAAVVQLPILTPYFMADPPGLFTDPPEIGPAYLGGLVVVIALSGLWTVLILHLALPARPRTRPAAVDPRASVVYGAVLGVISAIVMAIGTGTDLRTHWMWITLTLYVLAEPARLLAPSKMLGRVLGTLAGFGVVTVLFLTGIPDQVLQILALPALWLCLLFMLTKKPYWQYTLLLTVTVVLMNSYGVNTLLLDAERFGFTIVGAALSVVTAVLVNLLYYHRRGVRAPERADPERMPQ